MFSVPVLHNPYGDNVFQIVLPWLLVLLSDRIAIEMDSLSLPQVSYLIASPSMSIQKLRKCKEVHLG